MIVVPSVLRRALCAVALVAATFSTFNTAKADDDLPTGMKAAAAKAGLIDTIRLKLHHLHTGESINVVVKKDGQMVQTGLADLNHFLRDHRTQDTADYDPREFELLHALLAKLGKPDATIDIVCGYRTPQSNNFLRTRNAVTGVAEHSQHMLSKAIDIRIPGVSTLALRDAALSLGMGGVGYYPTSQFVHVDVGPVRQWQFGGTQVASTGRPPQTRSPRLTAQKTSRASSSF